MNSNKETNFWEALKKHNIELLASQIKKNGGSCENTVSSIIENLSYLTEKGESFGEEKRFIRLDVRRALASLCDSGRIVFKPSTIRWEDDRQVVTVGGYLYEIRPDGTEQTVSGFACGGASIEDIYPQEMQSENKRRSSLLSLASARAESNALFNAGIGIEFKNSDVFDLEEMEAKMPPAEPVMPTPVSQEERKAKAAARRAEKEKKSPAEPAKPEPEKESVKEPEKEEAKEVSVQEEATATEVKEEPVPAATPVAEETADKTEMTYEEAMKVPVDCGNYEGTPIGEILSKPQTARNISWVYKQNPQGRTAETKEALRVAIENYKGGALKNFL